MEDNWIKKLDRAARKRDGLVKPTQEDVPIMNLKTLRESAGLTQNEMAERLSMSRGSISLFERKGTGASIEKLTRYVEACGGELDLSFRSTKGFTVKLELSSSTQQGRAL